MIVTLGDVTGADALAACLATGDTSDDCAAVVAAHTVNGVYCDGDVSISLDASGQKVVTCAPTGELQKKLDAVKADCLANCGKDRGATLNQQCVPYCGGGATFVAPPSISPAIVVAGVAALFGLALFVVTR